MVLVANMVASTGSGPAIINFDLFVAVFTLLSLVYLIVATINESFVFHPALILALDLANTIWLFIGAVATAALLGTTSCSNGVSVPKTASLVTLLTDISGLRQAQQNHEKL
jgi:hypothetical protein